MLYLIRYDGAASELMRLVRRPQWLNGVASLAEGILVVLCYKNRVS